MAINSDTDADLARAVGFTLNAWSLVEEKLAVLFQGLLEHHRIETAFVIMATIVSFETRLAVVDALVQREPLLEDEIALWDKLKVKIGKGYKSRHQVAHFSFMYAWKDNELSWTKLAPFYSFGGAILGNESLIGVAEIEQKRVRFKELEDALDWMGRYLNMRRYSSEVSLQPEPALIVHLRQQITGTPAARQSSPQS